jgi:NAD(P)-dependent dehydrogenase (short-subunit alcohol dehydrogenase family)
MGHPAAMLDTGPGNPAGRQRGAGVFDLSGKVALVTGGSRGIGQGIALALATAGADVAVLGRDAAALGRTVSSITALGRRALGLRADVTDHAGMAEAVATAEAALGPIHTLVACAGIHAFRRFDELVPGEWDRLIATNIGGVLNATRAIAPGMIARRGGSVILVASIFALIGAPGNTIYSMTKGAVLGFSRALAVEWARHGIRVNAVCPGWINTDLNADLRADAKASEAALRQIPLGRFGEPRDIGPLVVYLAADESSFATGQEFVVDGGQVAR